MNNVYFCEGENEAHLIKELKNNKIITSGKVKKFNLWQKDFSRIKRNYNTKNDYLMFVIDVDCVDNMTIFMNNIKLLKSYNFCLIVQNKNFEDELCNACNIRITELLEIFKSQNKGEFKTNFNKTTDIYKKLRKHKFEFDNFWKTNQIDLNNLQLSNVINENICKNNKYRLTNNK